MPASAEPSSTKQQQAQRHRHYLQLPTSAYTHHARQHISCLHEQRASCVKCDLAHCQPYAHAPVPSAQAQQAGNVDKCCRQYEHTVPFAAAQALLRELLCKAVSIRASSPWQLRRVSLAEILAGRGQAKRAIGVYTARVVMQRRYTGRTARRCRHPCSSATRRADQ